MFSHTACTRCGVQTVSRQGRCNRSCRRTSSRPATVSVADTGWTESWRVLFDVMDGAALPVGVVVAPTAPDQRAAMVELYLSTNGSDWSDRGGWKDYATGSDPCDKSWYGLACSGSHDSPDRNMLVSRAICGPSGETRALAIVWE